MLLHLFRCRCEKAIAQVQRDWQQNKQQKIKTGITSSALNFMMMCVISQEDLLGVYVMSLFTALQTCLDELLLKYYFCVRKKSFAAIGLAIEGVTARMMQAVTFQPAYFHDYVLQLDQNLATVDVNATLYVNVSIYKSNPRRSWNASMNKTCCFKTCPHSCCCKKIRSNPFFFA